MRTAYRLDRTLNSAVHDAAHVAATRLGLDCPIEIYAYDGGPKANASLIYVPDRAVLLISGSLPARLSADELAAVAGHELAHHVLWSAGAGRYLAASRLLDAAEADARTPSEYLETARRFRLATELYADRGGLVGSESLGATISGLLKIDTGLAQVDVDAYLRQASEVDFSVGSAGTTHPETVLRAWALHQWAELGDDAEPLVGAALAPSLDLADLDIVGQDELAALTAQLVSALVGPSAYGGEEVEDLATRYGVTDRGGPVPDRYGARITAETRRYLAAVVVDFATADPDGGDAALSRAIGMGARLGLATQVERLLGELGLSDRKWASVRAGASS